MTVLHRCAALLLVRASAYSAGGSAATRLAQDVLSSVPFPLEEAPPYIDSKSELYELHGFAYGNARSAPLGFRA